MSQPENPLLVFDLPVGSYALPVSLSAEILDAPHGYPIPGATPFLAEAINVQGRAVPLLDLARFVDPDLSTPAGKVVLLRAEVADLAIKAGSVVCISAADQVMGGATGAEPYVVPVVITNKSVKLLDLPRLLNCLEQAIEAEERTAKGGET